MEVPVEVEAEPVAEVEPGRLPNPGEVREPAYAAPFQVEEDSYNWANGLSADERENIKEWGNSRYRTIRANIASGNIGDEERMFIKSIESAPKIDGVVYRGIRPGYAVSEESFVDELNRSVGTVIKWDSPSSTSIGPEIAQGFGEYVYEIDSKTARYIASASSHRDELEAVTMPGTRYRVMSVKKENYRSAISDDLRERTVVQIEELP